MNESELTVTTDFVEFKSWKKKLFFSLLKKLEYGSLRILENDHLVGSFGNARSELRGEINVLNEGFYSRMLFGGSIGAGESYIAGEWKTSNLTDVIRVFLRNESVLDEFEKKYSWLTRPVNKFKHLRNKNSLKQAKSNISSHYDLGNKLYASFLDDRMMYSSGVFKSDKDSLEQAQYEKLKCVGEKLDLKPHHQVVEIGTGWGGMAIFLAQEYGCHVTTTTISEEQYSWAKDKIHELGLEEKITLLKSDYRQLKGQYDRLVSVEMIEAVGADFMDEYFSVCQNLLKPDGVMVIQAITLVDQRMKNYMRNVDFIQKHIFPGGFLPSLNMILDRLTKNTDMIVRDIHDFGLDYAKTLNHWMRRFEKGFSGLKSSGYDSRFFNLWKFYLEGCEAGFLERTSSVAQITMTRRQCLTRTVRY